MAKTNKFNVPSGLMSQGKTCLEKLKTLLKFLDGTTSLILRSSKRWSMAAAISVGIDETDELMTDEDTLAGKGFHRQLLFVISTTVRTLAINTLEL